MESIIPVLDIIQVRLRGILTKNRDGMDSWDSIKLRDVGDDLIRLSVEVYPHLTLLGHRILYQSIREAGLGIRMRATLIKRRGLKEEDKEYFESVYEVLLNICQKIESGEYYRALIEMVDKRDRSENRSI
ncbi:hypothetical protein KEJ17_07075 [Candidatus Bathyarchaeota archaeon]|nr:hypothetical protein [Candidatus Bathyarchaeota archaeon]